MYLDFYHLKKAPFHITPDPEFLFLSPSHKAALGSIIYGIEERQGFVAISGEVGLGKTTILRSYLERVDPRQLRTIYIFNANVSFRGLLKAIFGEFGLDYENDDLFEMVNHLHQVLIDEYKQGRNVALIIDEAQNMPIETLENLRMLSNLETNTEKLVQIILIGQPEFDHKLNLNELRQLKQRLVIRSIIEPLTSEESLAYIHHRLTKVALTDEPIFTKSALKQIIGAAKGTPRALNILCTNTLIAGFGYRQRPIKAKTANKVIVDFQGKKPAAFLKPALAFSAMVVACTGVFWMSPYKAALLDKLHQTGPLQGVTETLRDAPGQSASYFAALRKDLLSAGKPAVEAASPEHDSQDPFVHNSEHGNDISAPALSETFAPHPEHVINTYDSGSESKEIEAQEDMRMLSEEPQESIFPIIKIIKKGEYVSKLAVEVYGFSSNEIISTLKQHNPRIKDMNKVEVGDKILFPALNLTKE